MSGKRLISVDLSSIDILTKRTRNLKDVLERLREYDVLTPSEIHHINCCSDDETSINLLYSIIAQKPTSNYNLFLYVLQDTDNDELARFLEQSLQKGQLTLNNDDQDKFDEHTSADLDKILISGGEMGIAELLEDNMKLSQNWKKLFHILHLPNACLSRYKYPENFVIQATLVLRDWSEHLKKRATVGNLCNILENEGFKQCAGRIRRMFGRYVDSGFGFDFPESGTFSNSLSDPGQSTGAMFPSIAEKMLTLWLEENGATTTTALDSTDHFASLLAINGHFHTSNKVSSL